MTSKRSRRGFGAVNVALAFGVAGAVFRLLPTRWWLVDGGALVIAVLLVLSGIALLFDQPIAERLTRLAGGVVLALGLSVFAALALTASYLQGVYGPVGKGGAIIFALVAALVLPYLVVYPAVLLLWIGPRANEDEP